MPLVGERSRFAVEYDLNASHGGESMFGRFCYWCGGRLVGDYELGTSLRDVLFQLEGLARYRCLRPIGASVPCRHCCLSATRWSPFGRADLNSARVAEEEQWARHDIFPPVEVFDFWKGFLVEDEQTARLFSRTPRI